MSAAAAAGVAMWEGQNVRALAQAWGLPGLTVHPLTDSTNDDARALAEAGAPPGTTVVADAQRRGRGRRGRTWRDEPGAAVLLSMVWSPGGAAPGAAPLRAGLAVAAALEAVLPAGAPRIGLKWPNDVLLGGRKVAGILCEGASGGPRPWLVVGVGINVHRAPAAEDDAAALADAGRPVPARLDVAAAVAVHLHAAGQAAGRPLDEAELAAWARRDALAGRAVTADGNPAGTVLGVAPDGALRLRAPDGAPILVRNGTIRGMDTSEEAR